MSKEKSCYIWTIAIATVIIGLFAMFSDAKAQTYDGPASGQIPMQGPLRSNYQPIDANDKLVVSDDIGGEFVRSASLVGGIVTIIYQDAAGIEQMISFTASGAAPPTPSMHARYFGWSADRTIATSDFSSATTSTTNVGTLPTVVTGGFVWFAVPQSQGYPTHIYLQGNTKIKALSGSSSPALSTTPPEKLISSASVFVLRHLTFPG